MEQSTVGKRVGEETLTSFENLVTKVLKDVSSLEHRLVDRIKSMENNILSNLSTSTSNIYHQTASADDDIVSEKRNDGDGGYQIVKDLNESYKVLESLIQETLTQAQSLERQDCSVARQVANKIQDRMSGVTSKLEQVFSLVNVLNSDELNRLCQCEPLRSSFVRSFPPTGCGDVIGQTPLGFAGISKNKTSQLELSFVSKSGCNLHRESPGFELGDFRSSLDGDLNFKNDFGKLLSFMNSSSLMLDLRRYVLSRHSTDNIKPNGSRFETKIAQDSTSSSSSSNEGASAEITLDTLVPCPHGKDTETFLHNEDGICCQQQQQHQQPLETSFPLQATLPLDSQESRNDITQSRDHLHRVSVHKTDGSQLDPTAYQIRTAVASCANIDMTTDTTPDIRSSQRFKQHKRTHSFNVASYIYNKHSKTSHNRPMSSLFDSIAQSIESGSSTSDGNTITGNTITGNNTQDEGSPTTHFPALCSPPTSKLLNFRRVKSEFSVKRRESEKFKNREKFQNKENIFKMSSNDNVGDERNNKQSERWKPRRKTSFLFQSTDECSRPTSGCVITNTDMEDHSFFSNRHLPFIDDKANIPSTELDENIYLSPILLNSPALIDDDEENTATTTTTTTTTTPTPTNNDDGTPRQVYANNYDQGQSSEINAKGHDELIDLVWPSSPPPCHVTYRKNAAKLRSRWDGFRRAFSMVFEKNNNNNNNNDNDNNINCRIRKASSTNFLDAREREFNSESKKSRSNWEVWKRQSRANLTESFRKKCSWLRLTFKRKRKWKGHVVELNQSHVVKLGQCQTQGQPDVDVITSPRSSGDQSDTERTQIVVKSTLASVTDELLKTEHDYVKSMKYVIDNYLPLINHNNLNSDNNYNHADNNNYNSDNNYNNSNNIHYYNNIVDNNSNDNNCYKIGAQSEVPEPLRGKNYVIFGNLEKLHDFHSRRFQESLRMCKGHPYALGSAFLRHETEFDLYALYSKNKPRSDQLMNDCGRKFFQMKQTDLMDPMDLESYLLKPIQRLSKYALMLKKILQTCPLDRLEYTELEASLEMIRFQLRHGEDLLAADCIIGCDVNLQDQGTLIRRDDLVVTKGLKKCHRHVFLFEDLILFAKTKPRPGGQDVYNYKYSLKTADIGLTENIGEDGKHFEIWFRKRTADNSFKLQASSKDSKTRWTADITQLLWRQTRKCRQRADAAVVMATGLGGNPLLAVNLDSSVYCRPESFASSSSSSSSSNTSVGQRSSSSSYAQRHTSSSPAQASSLNSSSSSNARPLTYLQSANHGERSTSSSSSSSSSTSRPLSFACKTSCLLPPFSISSAVEFQKLSPVKEQMT